MVKPVINIVWFKRDLRLHDHQPLVNALRAGKPTLLLHLEEPSLQSIPEYDPRHLNFVLQSLSALSRGLSLYGHRLYCIKAEALDVFKELVNDYDIDQVFSHEETGLAITFHRDKLMLRWFKNQGIKWMESPRDGIIRGLKHRRGWQEQWEKYMNAPQANPNLHQLKSVQLTGSLSGQTNGKHRVKQTDCQTGGEARAVALLDSFKSWRVNQYIRHIARPQYSQESCSRLSPHLAHGCISARRVYQETKRIKQAGRSTKNIAQFHSRLWWRCHYIQKLESEFQIEYQHLNRGFDNLDKPVQEDHYRAWANGETGYPMIDASMRCLMNTGYLNFRMRAMLATFWCFTLWQDWRRGAEHLARVFLDFEPGIHYPQFQMQAGMTGYHPLRIFNPIVQAEKYDDYGEFIKKWVPELKGLPGKLVAAPWKLTPLEQEWHGCVLGRDYPAPIVNYLKATQQAKDRYWSFRKKPEVRDRLEAIWELHSLPEDTLRYREQLKAEREILITQSVHYDQPPK